MAKDLVTNVQHYRLTNTTLPITDPSCNAADNSAHLKEFDLMFTAQTFHKTDIASLVAVLGQDTQQSLAPVM